MEKWKYVFVNALGVWIFICSIVALSGLFMGSVGGSRTAPKCEYRTRLSYIIPTYVPACLVGKWLAGDL